MLLVILHLFHLLSHCEVIVYGLSEIIFVEKCENLSHKFDEAIPTVH